MWPILALFGGVDDGLRVGGRCIQKSSQRTAIVLGVPRAGSSNVRLQWLDADKGIRLDDSVPLIYTYSPVLSIYTVSIL